MQIKSVLWQLMAWKDKPVFWLLGRFWLLSSFLVALSVRSWVYKCVCVCISCVQETEKVKEREREKDTLEWSKGKFKDFPPWLLPLNFCFLLKYKHEAGRWRQTFYFIGLDLTLGYFSQQRWKEVCLVYGMLIVCIFFSNSSLFSQLPKFTFSSMRDSWFLIWLEEWSYCENLGRSSYQHCKESF